MKKLAFTLFTILILLSIEVVTSKERKYNDVDKSIYLCGTDYHLSELLAHAGKMGLNGEHQKSIDIYTKILTIRPNCHDVYLQLALSYAIINDEKNYKENYKIYEKLKIEYQKQKPQQKKSQIIKIVEKKIIIKKPAKKDKINYWKWLFIYSILKK